MVGVAISGGWWFTFFAWSILDVAGRLPHGIINGDLTLVGEEVAWCWVATILFGSVWAIVNGGLRLAFFA